MTESLLSEYIARYHNNRIAEFVRYVTAELNAIGSQDKVDRGKVSRWLKNEALVKHKNKKLKSIYAKQLEL